MKTEFEQIIEASFSTRVLDHAALAEALVELDRLLGIVCDRHVRETLEFVRNRLVASCAAAPAVVRA